jgi:hypothetical protein
MTNDELAKRLALLGLPMLETGVNADVNETLAEVVRSADPRLWEGVPVLLANASDDLRFSLDQVNNLLNDDRQKEVFRRLVLLSAALYEQHNIRHTWMGRFSPSERALVKEWKKAFDENKAPVLENLPIDSSRVRRLFELYFRQNTPASKQRLEKMDEFSLSFALSQVFSPKQKELFYKRLEGLPLTKTEMEYYSRSVKKKVVALANSELHALSRKLLEQ